MKLTDIRDVFAGVEEKIYVISITCWVESSVHAKFSTIQIVGSTRMTLTLLMKDKNKKK